MKKLVKTFEGFSYMKDETNYKRVKTFLDEYFDMEENGMFVPKTGKTVPNHPEYLDGDMHNSPFEDIDDAEWHNLADRYKNEKKGIFESKKLEKGDTVEYKGDSYLLSKITNDIVAGLRDVKYYLTSFKKGVPNAIVDNIKDIKLQKKK